MAHVTSPVVPRDITADPGAEFRKKADRRRLWRGVFDSLLFHAVILGLLLGLWEVAPPPEVVLPPVTIKIEGPGGGGASGGGGGQASIPGERGASSALQANSAQPTASEPEPTPPDATPPEPVPQPKPTPTVVPLKTAPPKPPAHKPVSVAKQAPTPSPAPTPQPTQQAATATATPTPAQTADAGNPAAMGAGNSGVGSNGNGNVGSGGGGGGNGRGSGGGDDYLEQVRRHLMRYEHNPSTDNCKTVSVLVSFRLTRDGTVLDPKIEQSSGNQAFDRAAMAMLHDGSPVPPVPQKYWDKLDRPVQMPVEFTPALLDRLFKQCANGR